MSSPSAFAPLAACALALSVLSCDPDPGPRVAPDTTTRFAVPIPSTLANRAVDPDVLDVAVTVEGRAATVSSDANGARLATITVPPGVTLPVEITWFDRREGFVVPLFILSLDVAPLSTDSIIRVDEVYEEPDADGDGESNLDALEAGGDPFAALRPPSRPALDENAVRILRLAPGIEPPEIDGRYDGDDVWGNSTFTDVGGRQMLIDNLLVDRGADAADGEPVYKWFAMHDDESLYFFVQYEGARAPPVGGPRDDDEYTPVRDSEHRGDDDGLNLYFDGDASRRRTLDGVDDLYLQIPQVTPFDGTGAGVNVRFPFASDRDTPPPGFEYGSCVCRGDASNWELKIPLSLVGIEVGRPFALEVQIDQDLDGGERDARWAWARPSGTPGTSDVELGSPRTYGTAVLVEETGKMDE